MKTVTSRSGDPERVQQQQVSHCSLLLLLLLLDLLLLDWRKNRAAETSSVEVTRRHAFVTVNIVPLEGNASAVGLDRALCLYSKVI
ncbi:hypothetical protein SRHO_G00043680 [Serrasalmus rhombeus]